MECTRKYENNDNVFSTDRCIMLLTHACRPNPIHSKCVADFRTHCFFRLQKSQQFETIFETKYEYCINVTYVSIRQSSDVGLTDCYRSISLKLPMHKYIVLDV